MTKENKKVEEQKIDQTFQFDDKRRVLKVTTKGDNNGVIKNYIDEFSEDKIKEMHKEMVNSKNNMEKNIQTFEKSIEAHQESIDNNKLELNDRQKTLKEDLQVLTDYKPIADAIVMKERTEGNIKSLKEQLKEKNKIINEIETKCKGVKLR